jgi:hypothetical protein
MNAARSTNRPLFAVECPNCRAALAVKRARVGAAARCPSCDGDFLVPEPKLPEGTPPAPVMAGAPPQLPAGPAPAPVGGAGTAGLVGLVDLVAAPAVDRGLQFREPELMVGEGDDAVPLRRLSPEEKRLRRSRRNLLILIVGGGLLAALVQLLGGG